MLISYFFKIYKTKMKAASVNFRDRPSKPLDSALWWIDYTLRNSDTGSLKPLGIYQSWYSRRSLDLLLVMFLCVGILVIAVISLFLLYYCNLCNKCYQSKEGETNTKSGENKKSK